MLELRSKTGCWLCGRPDDVLVSVGGDVLGMCDACVEKCDWDEPQREGESDANED